MRHLINLFTLYKSSIEHNIELLVTHSSLVENQNDLELDFKVFFFVDSCCVGIVLDESN